MQGEFEDARTCPDFAETLDLHSLCAELRGWHGEIRTVSPPRHHHTR